MSGFGVFRHLSKTASASGQSSFLKNMREDISKYSIDRSDHNFIIHISFKPVEEALRKAQFALDTQVWADLQKYMPRRDGHLIGQTNRLNQSVAGTGKVYKYDPSVEYAHYQYEGVKYVDPVYGKGGFFSPTFGWWSRPGVRKVPSGEPLQYDNPNATPHWEDAAIANHGDEWFNLVKRIIDRASKK